MRTHTVTAYHPDALNRMLKLPFQGEWISAYETAEQAMLIANGSALRMYGKYNPAPQPRAPHSVVFELECDTLQVPQHPEAKYKCAYNAKPIAVDVALCDSDTCPCRKKVQQIKEAYPEIQIYIATVPRTLNTHKTCDDCRENKPMSDFVKVWDSEDGRGFTCKACRARAKEDRQSSYADRSEQFISNPRLRTANDFLALVSQLQVQPKSRASLPSDELERLGNDLSCLNCGETIDRYSGSVLSCSELCNQEAQLVRYIRKAMNDGRISQLDVLQDGVGVRLLMLYSGGYPYRARKLSPEQRTAVFERDGYKCRNCGKPATQIDHIDGSSSDLGNLQALCKECNVQKMQRGVRIITRETDPEIWEAVQAQKLRLAERVAAATPMQLSDSADWQHLWNKLSSLRKKNQKAVEVDENVLSEILDDERASLTTSERMFFYNESYEDAEERVQGEDFYSSDYFEDIMNRDD